MTYQHLLYAVDDRVATLTLNRPDQHNALSKVLIQELVAAIARADADPGVRVLVIDSAGGKSFSAGYDIKETADQPARSTAQWRARMQEDIAFTYAPWDCSKPVIALIEGYCYAGGLEFAMCCDMRYAADHSTFAALEARFSNGIATMMMPWLIGQRSRALIYTGDTIGAGEAFRLGLVDNVFPRDAARAETMKIARRMSRVSLECLQWNKRAVNHTFETMGLRNAIRYGAEACALMDSIGSPEADMFGSIRRKEGLAAALRWRAQQFADYE